MHNSEMKFYWKVPLGTAFSSQCDCRIIMFGWFPVVVTAFVTSANLSYVESG